MEFVPAPAVHRVLCADCGTPIVPNSANLCVACLRNTVDITEGIPKQGLYRKSGIYEMDAHPHSHPASVAYCRNCERFLSPPTAWTIARPESPELLSICLKKLKGLNKVRLTDARFIWTEPHSKRLRVAITIQKETFEIEFLVQYGQCPDCARLAAKNTWKALVQVRQKVSHKRTFLYLEQLILKHNAQKRHDLCQREFLNGVVPIRSKASEQLLSADTHSNTANFKFTYSVEIIPVCKDDLVCLPPKLARSLSNIHPLTICTRVGNSLQVMDVATLQTAEIPAQIYWRTPFESLASVTDLVEFTVLDIEPDYSKSRGKFVMADAQVALAGAFRSSGKIDEDDAMDYDATGKATTIFHTRTHLGAILQPGDTALGYHLTNSNYNSSDFSDLPTHLIPDIILVKKTYPNRRKKSKQRAWKLRSIAKEAGEEGETGAGRGVVGRMGGRDQKKVEEDYELFLRELEEDPELRAGVNMYKAAPKNAVDGDANDVRMTGPGAGGPAHGGSKKRKAKGRDVGGMDVDMGETGAEEEEDNEADFPEVKLDELLEDFDEMTLGNDEDAEEQE
ncbi:hypothetical protein NP233_g12232 [Leucocoprinus birnbaumii]|uniref:60S ribosomal export protein NMD3 n=1 Tax=Leucocoprinus birnbaumii TaxID=56174 RepID=A0AAD5VF76_9AGAR|nr:hypothetical protein NP233_g12232 [Leucocoprinus birnbaumii]